MLKLKLQYFGHLMRRVDSLEKTLMLGWIGGRRRRGRQRMRWLDGITDLMDLSLSELQELVMDREAWHAVIHRVTRVGHYWVTELNWTELNLEAVNYLTENMRLLKTNPWNQITLKKVTMEIHKIKIFQIQQDSRIFQDYLTIH